MNDKPNLKLLFIINPKSGNRKIDWPHEIQHYFRRLPHIIELFILPKYSPAKLIRNKIDHFVPDRVIAVGGDGTVKLGAHSLLKTNIPLGILPAGSANGLAKELGISLDPEKAIAIAVNGPPKKIHMVQINNNYCIHLSDIGFNAFIIKKFETGESRGWWGYLKASWKVLWSRPKMDVDILIKGENIKRQAAMVVVANATRYGTGALINPAGRLDDNVFEVIVVKKISLAEVYKMMVSHMPYDHQKTEVFQTDYLQLRSRRRAHFQIDGEYMGRVNTIKASIVLDAVQIIVPPASD